MQNKPDVETNKTNNSFIESPWKKKIPWLKVKMYLLTNENGKYAQNNPDLALNHTS